MEIPGKYIGILDSANSIFSVSEEFFQIVARREQFHACLPLVFMRSLATLNLKIASGHRVPSQVQPFNAHQPQLESATLIIAHLCSV